LSYTRRRKRNLQFRRRAGQVKLFFPRNRTEALAIVRSQGGAGILPARNVRFPAESRKQSRARCPRSPVSQAPRTADSRRFTRIFHTAIIGTAGFLAGCHGLCLTGLNGALSFRVSPVSPWLNLSANSNHGDTGSAGFFFILH